MGITFERGLLVAGYRATVFKNALSGYCRTLSRGNMVDLKTVFANRRDGAIVFEECIDRALINDDEKGEVTEAGLSIIRGKARQKTALPIARAVLKTFLANIDAMNADPEQALFVDQVWLYGSVMRGSETVGDIDAVVLTSRRPQWDRRWDEMRKHVRKIAKRRGISLPNYGVGHYFIEKILSDRAIYGARRHALLAGVQSDVEDLKALGVPCQIIYDRVRNGVVDDPILPRHPESPGRGNDQPAPATMPDLNPVALLRPMDGRWVSKYEKFGTVHPYEIFRGWSDVARNLFPRFPEGLRVFAADDEPFNWLWRPKAMRRPGCNGRDTVLIGNRTGDFSLSVCLRRQIEASEHLWTLQVHFSDIESSRKRKRFDFLMLYEMFSAALLIIAADAERLLRRASESKARPEVVIAIHESEDTIVNENFARDVYERLAAGAVRIEPENWDAQCRIKLVPAAKVNLICSRAAS